MMLGNVLALAYLGWGSHFNSTRVSFRPTAFPSGVSRGLSPHSAWAAQMFPGAGTNAGVVVT